MLTASVITCLTDRDSLQPVSLKGQHSVITCLTDQDSLQPVSLKGKHRKEAGPLVTAQRKPEAHTPWS